MNPGWRRLPPSHSPLTARAIGRGLQAMLTGTDPRPTLVARLRVAYGAASVTLTDSGTTALQLAIRSVHAGQAPGASVAIPAYSCYDVATAAVASDAPLAIYDIDPRTLGPDPASLTRCLAEGARTIVVAPLYGVPIDWSALAALAAPWEAQIIEDAAQGSGAEWAGRPLGTLADVSVLSFGRGKGWTGGSGGALLDRRHASASQEIAPPQRSSVMSEVRGMVAVLGQWILGRPVLFALPAALPWLHLGETRYRAPESVRPMRRSAAALLLATGEGAAIEAALRRAAGVQLRSVLGPLPGVDVVSAPSGGLAGDLRLPLLLEQGSTALLQTPRAKQLGLGPPYPTPLADLPAIRARLVAWSRDLTWPGATEIVHRLVTVPTHSLTTGEDQRALLALFEDHATSGRANSRS